MCWTKTRDQGAAIFNLHSSNLQHDMLQPQRVNTLNVLARCHFGGLNGTYTYMLFGQVEFDFAKASFKPIFCKTQVFLSKILVLRGTLFYPSFPIKF
jgi:aminoglycoside N3'-acetyltransferase